jgi:hypothetical protein
MKIYLTASHSKSSTLIQSNGLVTSSGLIDTSRTPLVEQQHYMLAQSLCDVLNIPLNGKELVGLIGKGIEHSNFQAIIFWLGQRHRLHVEKGDQQVVDVGRIAFDLLDEIQDFYLHRDLA